MLPASLFFLGRHNDAGGIVYKKGAAAFAGRLFVFQ